MFAKRKKPPFIEVTKLSSLIAEDVEITGDLSFTNGIRVDGRITGNVVGRAGTGPARALLVLSDKGRIDGNVSCGDAVINGCIVGDLHIEHFLELKPNAQVTGTIHYEHLHMDVGASVRGQLQKTAPGNDVTDAPTGDNVVELPVEVAARK
ncbi:MAG: polymer-forming cytoskeletal protein [Rubrivivax sp.]|nr:polymer-forming cytoskeletal protein [Rubrivivax sp.]